MDFYLADFNKEAQEAISEYNKTLSTNSAPIAVLCDFEYNDKISSVAGELDKIQKLIPILKEMGYDDFNLYYEDCDVWVLKWHNPKLDCMRWMLIE